MRARVRDWIEALVHSELDTALQRPRYGRSTGGETEPAVAPVRGYRNGSRTRTLTGTFGKTDIGAAWYHAILGLVGRDMGRYSSAEGKCDSLERLALLAQRVTIGCLAIALAFNAATPFITPNPPWLSDVPVVCAIMMLLIIIGLLHRIQNEPDDGG